MGIAGKAIGDAGNMPGMLCIGCMAPGMAKPGGIACMGVPPGLIIYGIPCISYMSILRTAKWGMFSCAN